MQRLTGIGVSPGVVVGRAVILIQRAQVLRYRIVPSERVEHELARLEREPAAIAAAAAATSGRAWRAAAAPSWRRSSTPSC